MMSRFEIAKEISSDGSEMFRTDEPVPVEQRIFPILSDRLYDEGIAKTLSASTHKALDKAKSMQQWNQYLLSSPEFMRR